MSYTGSLEAHSLIVDAIRQDFRTVTNFNFAGETIAILDDHDPLGVAFYVYALLKTSSVDIETETLPDYARTWAEDKSQSGDVSAYTDRDLAAIGLITYSFCKYRQVCPNIGSEFIHLVENTFKDNKGLFGNFLATVLVGLSLKELRTHNELFGRFSSYLYGQIQDHAHTIYNDAKNLVVAYLWAKEIESESLLAGVRHECLERLNQEDPLFRDRIYITYVLLEELENLPKLQWGSIKKNVLGSLDFIQTYSTGSVATIEQKNEYADDVVLSPHLMNYYGHTVKPRFSRILLSTALMIDNSYKAKANLFLSKEAKISGVLTGGLYFAFCWILGFFLFRYGHKAGLPLSVKTSLDYGSFISATIVFSYSFLINFVWLIFISGLLIASFIFFMEFAIGGQSVSAISAGREVVHIMRKHFLLNLIANILVAFILSILA